MNLQELKILFFAKWQLAKNLAKYADGGNENFDFAGLSESSQMALKTDESKQQLARWRQGFMRSYMYLEEFERTSRMTEYDYEDWLDAVNAVTTILVRLDYLLAEYVSKSCAS